MKTMTRNLLFALALLLVLALLPHHLSTALPLLCIGLVAANNATLTNTPVLLVPVTAGVYEVLHGINTLIGGSSVSLKSISLSNPSNAVAYFQFFDAASAGAVTLGTTVPTFWIAVATVNVQNLEFGPVGYVFKSGLVVAVTTTPTGGAAPSSNCPISALFN
jgi:hypothetical protein